MASAIAESRTPSAVRRCERPPIGAFLDSLLAETSIDLANSFGYAEPMEVLRYAKLTIPPRLAPSFEKVRAAIERDDFYSADLKKLSTGDFFRARLDHDSRLLVRFVPRDHRRRHAAPLDPFPGKPDVYVPLDRLLALDLLEPASRALLDQSAE